MGETIQERREAPRVVITTGEILDDRSIVEPILQSGSSTQLELVRWNANREERASRIVTADTVFEAPALDPSVLRALRIPDRVGPAEPMRKLWDDMAREFAAFTALPESTVALCVNFAIATWFVLNFPTAPWLAISGPNAMVGMQLLDLFRCFCRRALPIASPSPATVRSLPGGWHFTLLVSEPCISPQTERLLRVGLRRDQFLPARGQLLDLYGAVATFTSAPPCMPPGGPCAIEIPALATAAQPQLLMLEKQVKLARDFQPRLFGYYLRNHALAIPSAADAAQLHFSMRELGRNLAACISGDEQLKIDVLDQLEIQDKANQVSRSTDPDAIIIETLLSFCHEGVDRVYVGEVARRADDIAHARGEQQDWQPRAVGARLRFMGFYAARRDQKGYPLLLKDDVQHRIHMLAFAASVPAVQGDSVGCARCKRQASAAQRG